MSGVAPVLRSRLSHRIALVGAVPPRRAALVAGVTGGLLPVLLVWVNDRIVALPFEMLVGLAPVTFLGLVTGGQGSELALALVMGTLGNAGLWALVVFTLTWARVRARVLMWAVVVGLIAYWALIWGIGLSFLRP